MNHLSMSKYACQKYGHFFSFFSVLYYGLKQKQKFVVLSFFLFRGKMNDNDQYVCVWGGELISSKYFRLLYRFDICNIKVSSSDIY